MVVLEALDGRWRIDSNVRELPGRPDVVVPSLRLAIFVDGCFFHRCPQHGRIPDSNVEYWKPKLEGNTVRDARDRRKLRRMGYAVWRFWEHDFKTLTALESTRTVLHRRIAVRRAEVAIR